jgi:RNA polymerase sigma factor (sigma-70 family)
MISMVDFEKERPRLVRAAMTYLHNASQAEEAADYAIVRGMEAFDKYKPLHPSAWLFGILRNWCLHQIRDKKREEANRFWVPYPKSALEEVLLLELRDQVDRAVMKLTPEQWEAVYLREMLDLSYAEIASLTGKGEGAMRAIIHRARARLAPMLLDWAS